MFLWALAPVKCLGVVWQNMSHCGGVQIAKWLQFCFVTSLMHAPAVVIMDDVDALIPVIPEHAPPQEQHIIAVVNEFLASVLDWMREKVRRSLAFFFFTEIKAKSKIHT